MSEIRRLIMDRRIFQRIRTNFDVDIKEPTMDSVYNGTTVDLSAGGISIDSSSQIKSKDKLDLWLKFPDGHQPFHTTGRPIWSEKNKADTWRTGIVFDNIRFMGLWRVFGPV